MVRCGALLKAAWTFPKSGQNSYSSRSHSNPITFVLIIESMVTPRLQASTALFSTPNLCFKTTE